MHGTSSKMDSSMVWGEMQANCNLIDDTNLWKPIKEYQNITADCERNIDKQILCSNDSALESDNEEKLFYDPVGSHLIELRNYYLYLDEHLRLTTKKASKKSGKTMKRKADNNYFTIPAFPLKYPFSQSVEAPSQDVCKMTVKFKDSPKEITKYQVDKMRVAFIKRVFEQIGIYGIDNENLALEYLSVLLDSFLQKFFRCLSKNTYSDTFCKDENPEDLWNPLETTLHDFGISGISGLHAFYYENIVKKHDVLLKKCMNMYNQLQNQLSDE